MRSISLSHNAVPKEAEKELIKVFRSGQYSPDRKVKEFEDAWAKLHQSKYAVFVNSGTDALRLSLLALKEKYGWRSGSKVMVPALTFVATVNVILQCGLEPWFVDVHARMYTIDPDEMEKDIRNGGTHRIVAVMPVHLFGQRCSRRVFEIAKRRGWNVLEDSCETILNKTRGDVSCHSTYMAHHVTTGVGGMATTNDKALRELIWSYANHGRREPKKFQFERMGYSSRATEFEAVLGLSQMKQVWDNIKKRQTIAEDICLKLRGGPFQLPHGGYAEGNTFMMFPLVIKQGETIDRDTLCERLEKNGIETRLMMPITNQKCYEGLVHENDFPVAEWINRCGFYVPCHSGMGTEDVDYIQAILAKEIKE